jgi:hypothetical protein
LRGGGGAAGVSCALASDYEVISDCGLWR